MTVGQFWAVFEHIAQTHTHIVCGIVSVTNMKQLTLAEKSVQESDDTKVARISSG